VRARANNKFVSTGAGNLIANADSAATAAERFDIVALSGGNVALRSRATNLYVCAENAGAAPLIANRTAIGTWEKFDLVAG
jgi:hypothetical protein